jgi:hypothetical protein
VLEFRSSNDRHKPVIDALKLIERHRDSSTSYLPLGETIPQEVWCARTGWSSRYTPPTRAHGG